MIMKEELKVGVLTRQKIVLFENSAEESTFIIISYKECGFI